MTPPIPIPTSATIPPNEFKGRNSIIKQVCQRLDNQLSSSCLVGGPMTGRTSLLLYLTSEHAQAKYPILAKSKNVYIPGGTFGSTTTPSEFWVRCFKELLRQINLGTFQATVDKVLKEAETNTIDIFHLEDVFDTFARANSPIVLFVNDFENLLKASEFWPPDNFFHIVRSLGQRVPRGLAFVITTPRPLIDLWDPTKGASPFYSIFENLAMGRLEKEEIQTVVRDIFSSAGVRSDENVEDLVIAASDQHPRLVNYVAGVCADMLNEGKTITESALSQLFREPGGVVVTLIRQMRGHLTVIERQWLDMTQSDFDTLRKNQKELLRKLWDYGLIPPGTKNL